LRPFCVNSAQAFCPNAAIRWRGSNNLIVIVGHSPHEEPLLVLRIDDPEFSDCCFQR
jgi:hypothetical protein